MLKAFRGPMFAPDGGGGSGGDDGEALTRIAIKKARIAADERFSDLLEAVGFKDAAEMKAFVKEMRSAKADSATETPKVEPIKGLELVPTPPIPGPDAAAVAAEAAKQKELMAVKIDMAGAGIKKDDLDWAADRYLKRKGDLPPSGVAAFNVESYVAGLRTEHPSVFRDAVVVPPVVPGAVPPVVPAVPPPPNTGNPVPPVVPGNGAAFDARKSSVTSAEVQARLAEVLKS